MSPREATVVVEPDPDVAAVIIAACPGTVLRAADAERALPSSALPDGDTAVVVLGPSMALDTVAALAERWRARDPRVGVIAVRRRVDARSLAAFLRAGVRAVIAEHELDELGPAIRRTHRECARLRVVDSGPQAHGRITTVFAAKGGVGKTTVATNLAAALAARGERVALLDLDVAFGDVAVALDLQPRRTLADATPSNLDEERLDALLTRHASGVRVLAAPPDPATATSIGAAHVAAVLAALTRGFDQVVVDTPPALDELVLAALDATDRLVLVATLDVPALRNLRTALDTLDLIGLPRDRRRVLLNRADAEAGVRRADVVPALGCDIAGALPSSRDVPAAVNRGVLLTHTSPGHPFSRALASFADAHIPVVADLPVAEASRKAWPARLLAGARA